MKMGLGFWVVVAAAGVGGFYCFRRLQEMEEDIREEIAASQEAATQDAKETPASPESAPVTLADQVLSLVRKHPGRLQTELYRDLAQVSRRDLQALLLELDREGRLRRVKEKSTYKLYPA